LNGEKRWIGNATFADYIVVWARNRDDGNRVQGFVVERQAIGFTAKKMLGKMATRSTQNAEIFFKDVFVPDHNKLTYATDFQKGTNQILKTSRLMVAWWCVGTAAGAFETARKYCLERKQFGKPIAKFQLIQERLSRMMADVEFMVAHLAHLSTLMDKDKDSVSMG